MIKSIQSLFFAIFIALVFRYSVASPYKIPTGSMIPTLKIGDFIFVSKLSYAIKIPFTNKNLFQYDTPKRGDIVVFEFPDDPKYDYIKRVVGIEGDVIEIREQQLYINDVAVDKKEVVSKKYLYDHYFSNDTSDYHLFRENLDGVQHIILQRDNPFPELNYFGPYKVPKGHVFTIGDNRDNSHDGRFWDNKPLPIKNIRGKAMFVWISLDYKNPLVSLGNVSIPSIRSHRFGMAIK